MTRVLVCGSRDWGDRRSISRRLQSLPVDATIVHGAASRRVDGVEKSADMIADDVARSLGLSVEQHPANWREWPRTAGFVRNIEMLDSGVDLVIAFQRDLSRGTQHTINEARKRGVDVEVHRA
jgi:hypothetical protein